MTNNHGPLSESVHEIDGLSPNFGPLSTWTGRRMDGPQTTVFVRGGLIPNLLEDSARPNLHWNLPVRARRWQGRQILKIVWMSEDVVALSTFQKKFWIFYLSWKLSKCAFVKKTLTDCWPIDSATAKIFKFILSFFYLLSFLSDRCV